MGLFPQTQVGPLAGLFIWSFVVLLIIGVLGGITTLGIIAFAVIFALLILILYFLLARIVNRLLGRRVKQRGKRRK